MRGQTEKGKRVHSEMIWPPKIIPHLTANRLDQPLYLDYSYHSVLLVLMDIQHRHFNTMRPLIRRSNKHSIKRLFGLFAASRWFCRASGLGVVVVTGTTRAKGPPWPILGPRVTAFVVNNLERRGNKVTVIDPRERPLPLLEKPHFAYSKSQQPPELKELHQILAAPDAYVTITPEYNHAPSPALLNILNHFGSSTFSFKPSAIVSYSAG